MDLVALGASHRTATLEAREALALLPRERVLEELRGAGAEEQVVLSTCNRFEVYACGPAGVLPRALSALEGLAGRPLGEHSYALTGPRAALHLFEVAAGLDSLVVGETEILGQVRDAYEAARAAGATGKRLNVLFQRALFVGKRVRSETAIAVGPTSVASVAVQLAESIFGDLAGRRALLLGAGQMAELAARRLQAGGVGSLFVANRSWERAAELARRLGVSPVAWEAFPPLLTEVDVVLSSTASPRPVVTREMVACAARRRSGSLFLIDIAMPRDVEEEVHGIDQVYLYRLEDLERIVSETMRSRAGEVAHARAMVAQRAGEFSAWEASLETGSELSLRHARRADPSSSFEPGPSEPAPLGTPAARGI